MLQKGGGSHLYWTRADGTGGTLRLTATKARRFLGSWRPDGRLLVFNQVPAVNSSIFALAIGGSEKEGWKPGEPQPLPGGPSWEVSLSFSPDGRWLAYQSDESGDSEIYVRSYPGPGGKWQISNAGGFLPKWSHDGKQLLYRTEDNQIMFVTYTASGDFFHADKPQLWSPGQFSDRLGAANFDLSPDGKRAVVLRVPTSDNLPITKVTFVFNFFDELQRKSQSQIVEPAR